MIVYAVRCTDGNFAVALKSGGHCYGIVYDAETKSEALRTLGRWATTPELNFSWSDAAALAQQIRRLTLDGVI